MITNLFPTQLMHERFTPSNPLSFTEGWEDRWISNTSDMSELKQFIDQKVNEYFETCGFFGITLAPASVWLNDKVGNGSYILPHTHGPMLVSWSYYINVPKDSGAIVFLDPKGNNSWNVFYHPPHPGRSLNQDYHYRIEPTQGDLLIFPSWISHYVEPNTSGERRISIAGDYHTRSTIENFKL